nr:metallophosphoesterase family protein [Oleiagrimonas sp. C23AA]
MSDTHGVLDARIAELIGADDIAVHGGDIGAEDVLETLTARAARLVAVSGNNDDAKRWKGAVSAREALPIEARLDLPGGELVVVHGDAWPAKARHARLRAQFPGARAIFYGHSHRALIDDDTTPWVLNAGAAGRQRTYGGPSCIRLDASDDGWQLELMRFPL